MTPRIAVAAAAHALALTCAPFAAQAQQQTPPQPMPPAAVAARPAAAAVSPAALAAAIRQHKAGVLHGLQLSAVQQDRLLANLQQQGWSPPMVMQQSFQVPPPSMAGMAGECPRYMANWRSDLDAARAGLTRLVAMNNASDVPLFEQNIPRDCAYQELAYYLGVLARFGGTEPSQ
jgi:hypothetical protein